MKMVSLGTGKNFSVFVVVAFVALNLAPQVRAQSLSDIPQHPGLENATYENFDFQNVPQSWDNEYLGDFYKALNLEDIDVNGTNTIITYHAAMEPHELRDYIPPGDAATQMLDSGWFWVEESAGPGFWTTAYWKPLPTNEMVFMWSYLGDNYAVLKMAYFSLLPLPEDSTIGYSSYPMFDNYYEWMLVKEFGDNHPLRRVVVTQSSTAKLYVSGNDTLEATPLVAPPGISSPPAEVVYNYLEISGTLIENKSATMEFVLSKDQINAAGGDKTSVRLFRFSIDQWMEIPTQITGEDIDNVYFSAETTGTSLFAIAGQTAQVSVWYAQPLNIALITLVIVTALGAVYWFKFRR